MSVLPSYAAKQRWAQRPTLVWAWMFVLALALLGTQVLGQLHGIVHHHAEYSEPGLLEPLFSGHQDGDTDCHVYDQLNHCDVLPGVAVVLLPLVLAPFLVSLLSGLATARWHALFQARGPPSLR